MTTRRQALIGMVGAASLTLAPTFGLAADGTNAPGLAVGKKAPAFTLKDQNGKDTTLDALISQDRVALVFHRSANW